MSAELRAALRVLGQTVFATVWLAAFAVPAAAQDVDEQIRMRVEELAASGM